MHHVSHWASFVLDNYKQLTGPRHYKQLTGPRHWETYFSAHFIWYLKLKETKAIQV